MDIRRGPGGRDAFEPDAIVPCEYVDERFRGATPKFACRLKDGDVVKVKYGRPNGEVYAEVAGTRLLWALGFGADHMYPVRVLCRGCPRQFPKAASGVVQGDAVLFEPAAIERKMPGEEIEASDTVGWSWPELDDVDERAGGAPLAERDALKLMAVFIQHTDSKPEQQRLTCLSSREEIDAEGGCSRPFMMIDDLGATFGRANLFNKNELSGANFERWSKTPVWKDADRCVGNLPKSQTGTLVDPVISETGRRFLADLLVQLSDSQLRDLFEVARFPERPRNVTGTGPGASADEWVDAFKEKRDEIVNHACP
jgi:hypothetical protein